MNATAKLSFNRLGSQVGQLSAGGSHSEALELILRQRQHLPEQAAQLTFWRACLVARLGDPAAALQVLTEAIAAGDWFPETALRGEPDLQPLRGASEFERLVRVSSERQTLAAATSEPTRLTIEPPAQAPPHPLLIALHGNNSNAALSAGFWRSATSAGWTVALVQSSQIRWPGAYVWNDRDRTIRELKECYITLCNQHPIDPTRVVVAGFSMGATAAIDVGLSGAFPTRGFIAVAPASVADRDWDVGMKLRVGKRPRGSFILGAEDALGYEDSQALVARLQAGGIACRTEIHPRLGHDFPPRFRYSLRRALSFLLDEPQGVCATLEADG